MVAQVGGDLLGGVHLALVVLVDDQLQGDLLALGEARLFHGDVEVIRGVGDVQLLRVEVGGGRQGELGGAAVAQQVRADAAGAVNAQAQGPAELGVIQGLPVGVHADIVQCGGGGVGVAAGAVHIAGDIGRQVVDQQLDLPGVEGIGHGVGVLAAHQLDALEGHLAAAPVFVEAEIALAVLLPGNIGAGAQGDSLVLGARLDNGNVQQGHKGGVVPLEGNLHRVAGAVKGLHIPEPCAVAGGLHGPAEGGDHIVGRQLRAVRELDIGAQADGVGEGFAVVVPGLGQTGLGGKVGVQGEEPLVEQGTQHLVGAVGTGDGVHGVALEVGEGEAGEGGDLVLVLVHRLIVLHQRLEGVILGAVVPLAAACQRQQAEDQHQGEDSFCHWGFLPSWSEIMAVWTPRAWPILRWDQ